jgi:hypothetical protein
MREMKKWLRRLAPERQLGPAADTPSNRVVVKRPV